MNLIVKRIVFVITVMLFADKIVFAEKTPFKAGLRSLLVPGWGQYYNEQKTKGIIICSTEILFISGLIYAGIKSDEMYDKYRNEIMQSEIDKYYDKANTYHYINNYSIIGAITVWAYSIVDAYIVNKKHRKNITACPEDKKWTVNMDRRKIRIEFVKKF